MKILTQTVEGEIGLIGAEFRLKEAASIYEVAGEALALKNSFQVNTCKEINALKKVLLITQSLLEQSRGLTTRG